MNALRKIAAWPFNKVRGLVRWLHRFLVSEIAIRADDAADSCMEIGDYRGWMEQKTKAEAYWRRWHKMRDEANS